MAVKMNCLELQSTDEIQMLLWKFFKTIKGFTLLGVDLKVQKVLVEKQVHFLFNQ